MPKLTKENIIGGSEIPTIVLKGSRFSTPNQIMHKKLAAKSGQVYEQQVMHQQALDRGNFLEPGILEWASDYLDKQCLGETYVHLQIPDKAYLHDTSRLGVSLDGLLTIRGGELQIDNPFKGLEGEDNQVTLFGTGPLEAKTDAYDDGPPHQENVIQLHAQMMCTKSDWGIIAKLGPKMRLGIYPYFRDDALCEMILDATDDFWRRCDVEPPAYYPELVEEKNLEKNVEVADGINTDIEQLAKDYLACKDASNQQSSATTEVKDALELYLASLDPEDKHSVNATVGEYKISWQKVHRKAQPEKLTPSKPASFYRKLTITKGEEV